MRCVLFNLYKKVFRAAFHPPVMCDKFPSPAPSIKNLRQTPYAIIVLNNLQNILNAEEG